MSVTHNGSRASSSVSSVVKEVPAVQTLTVPAVPAVPVTPEPSFSGMDDLLIIRTAGKGFHIDYNNPPMLPEKITVKRETFVNGVSQGLKDVNVNKTDADGNVIYSTTPMDRKGMHALMSRAVLSLPENAGVSLVWQENGTTFSRKCRIVSSVKSADKNPANTLVYLSLARADGTRYEPADEKGRRIGFRVHRLVSCQYDG